MTKPVNQIINRLWEIQAQTTQLSLDPYGTMMRPTFDAERKKRIGELIVAINSLKMRG